jgi:hypothetical protein
MPLSTASVPVSRETPLYVLKGPIETEGAVRLLSTLKKSALQFRTYDPIEVPRLSLLEAMRQVSMSMGVVGYLLDPDRAKASVHNARCVPNDNYTCALTTTTPVHV